MGNLVIQVDEIYEAGNWDLANRLKPLITDRKASVNIKYMPQMEINNYARFVMFSNNTAPLSIEDGDRRYFVIECKQQPQPDEYYTALHRFIDSKEGMDAIYSWLMRRNITAFNPHARPPMTEAKRAIVEASQNPLREYVTSCVESGHFAEKLGMEFSLDALQRLLKDDGFGNHAKNLKELAQALRAADVKQFRRTERRSKKRLYRLPIGRRRSQHSVSLEALDF